MKKIYANGFILTVEDYVSSVYFDRSNKYKNCRVYRNVDSNIISVRYKPGSKIRELPDKLFTLIDPPKTELTIEGKVFPRNTITLNGIEYIQPYDADYQTMSIHLIHKETDLGVEHSRVGVYNNNLYIALLDTEFPSMTADDYAEYLNNTGLIYCRILNRKEFNISNAYSLLFDNFTYNYIDKAILGMQKEFYVNDVTVTADFIRQMRERHPEIQFYARGEDKNQTKYNEWVNYKITPSPIKHGTLWTSHVQHNAIWDRYWQDALDIEFEYTSNDLPTLLTRRDQFRVGGFFNEDRQFSYIIDNGGGEEFDIGYTVFWDRDTLEQDYTKQTSLDDNAYSQFSYKYTARLGYTNIEEGYTTRSLNLVEKVIYTILYAPSMVDLRKWDDGVNLLPTDLDFKTFLLEYSKLSTDFLEKYGIDIHYDPGDTAMVINEYNNPSQKFYNRINNDLIELSNNIKTIEEAATEQSNFVMVTSIKNVQKLLDAYRSNILEHLNLDVNVDFDIEDNVDTPDPNDRTMTVDTKPLDPPPGLEPRNDEEESPIVDPNEPEPSEPEPEEPDNEEEEDDNYDDPTINTMGEYVNHKMDRGLIL